MKISIYIFSGLLTMSSLMALSCKHQSENHETKADSHNESASKNSEEIVLEPEAAVVFGVDIDTVRTGNFHEVIKATGLVMPASGETGIISAPKDGIVHFRKLSIGSDVARGTVIASIDSHAVSGGDSNAAAKAALETAKTEYERISALFKSRLVTASEYAAAKTAYELALNAYSPSASNGSATSPIKGVLTGLLVAEGQYVEAGTPIATVASAQSVTLKVDIPRKYSSQLPTIDNLILTTTYSDKPIDIASLGGYRVKGANIASETGATAYIPVYFTVNNNGSLEPGSTFTAYLTGLDRNNVITVPVSALSEQQGQYYIYERLDDECYAKHLVRTGSSDGKKIEILNGIEPGKLIVVEGVTTVRLAETGSAIPEGHTHNH